MTESARTGAMLQSEWDSKITTAQLADFLNMTVKSVAVSQSIFDNTKNIFRGLLESKILRKC